MLIKAQARPSFCFMPPEKAPGEPAGEALQIGEGQQALEGATPLSAHDVPQVGVQVQVLLHRQILVQPKTLRHVADSLPDHVQFRARVSAADVQPPVGGQQQAREQAQQGRLAGTVRADNAGDFPRTDARAKTIDGRRVAARNRLVRFSARIKASSLMALVPATQTLPERQAPRLGQTRLHGHRHPLPQAAVGVVHDHAQPVDEIGPDLARLDRLGSEFGGRGDEADMGRSKAGRGPCRW